MTPEQERQAAAQRCADLCNAAERSQGCYEAKDWLDSRLPEVWRVSFDQTLALHRLASMVVELCEPYTASTDSPMGRILTEARQHILPEPKPSAVERLGERAKWSPAYYAMFQAHLDALGLQLVEVSNG